MQNNGIEVDIQVNGRTVTEFKHNSKVYIEGRDRSNFEIRMSNGTNKRKLFIPSVDGLSVVNGKPASNDSPGFVLEPRDEAVIPGWQLDQDTVAKFFFSLSQKKDSYSTQSGFGDANTGVIGVRVFEQAKVKAKPKNTDKETIKQLRKEIKELNESLAFLRGLLGKDNYQPLIQPIKPWPSPYSPTWNTADDTTRGITSKSFHVGSIDSALSCSSVEPDNMIGVCLDGEPLFNRSDVVFNGKGNEVGLATGMGKEETFEVSETEFQKGDIVSDFLFSYDTRRALESIGIEVVKKKTRGLKSGAYAFPGDFCKKP